MLEPCYIHRYRLNVSFIHCRNTCAGFGGGLTTMPLITLMLPVKMATPLSVIVGTATAIYATWLSRKETDWRRTLFYRLFWHSGGLRAPFPIYLIT